jgi:alkylation response protein AidB-like acyl-CoA dehydrogenase
MATVAVPEPKTMLTLPGDAVRQILWRFADRFDLQMLVQSARSVARGTVARLVAAGERNTHEWTPGKAGMMEDFDRAGVTAAFMEPEEGGFIAGPKNLALALAAYELAWVDGGAATASMASFLALSPIHERGTPAQVTRYKSLAAPPQPGEDRKPWRGAFALTEPIPYVGVDTGMLNGKVSISVWKDGEEPWLQVDKRGRFITNIAFANFVTAAVNSCDPRVKGSCVVILEEDDEGIYDHGTPTKKLVHQLSSTGDPIFSLKVPASRIVGGYTIKDGVIIPNFNHSEIIEAVFRRTRVPVGLMTAAKLLSSIEPVIRYQRQRFRGAEGSKPGSVRYEQGIQQREDALHRLVDIWATGEAASSLGFAAARLFDDLDPLEKQKTVILKERGGAQGGRAELKALKESELRAIELLSLKENDPRRAELAADPLVDYVLKDAEANVICPATKLWNTGHGANMMREAVSLMGGYGITEDCPGFLANKWMDAQLEATYEGPEAVQRRQLTVTMTSEVFLAQFRTWIRQMRRIASDRPGTGACTLASAMNLWLWTLNYLQKATDPDGNKLYHGQRQGVTFALADALCWLLASRYQILDVLELEARGSADAVAAEGLTGTVQFLSDLCHTQAAQAAGEASRICAELVFGYNCHPSWDEQEHRNCFLASELDEYEETMPGISAFAVDVLADDGTHPQKAGPCAGCAGSSEFLRLQSKLTTCLTGARLAKDRAAETVSKVMIPEALDYPA